MKNEKRKIMKVPEEDLVKTILDYWDVKERELIKEMEEEKQHEEPMNYDSD